MNNFDLTLNQVFTKKPSFGVIEESRGIFFEFDDKRSESVPTANMYVGSAESIFWSRKNAGFGVNDGYCDRCGGIIPAWVRSGLCEKCEEEVIYECKNKPFWMEDKNSEVYEGENSWLFL